MNDEQKDIQAKENLDSSLELSADQQTKDGSETPNQPVVDSNNPNSTPPPTKSPNNQSLKKTLLKLSNRWSIYVPIFIILLVGLIVVTIIFYNNQHKTSPSIAQQTLSSSALSKLANSSQTVGNSNEVLTVQSSSIFNGQVLVRGQLQVAGQLEIGGGLTLTGITVSGTSVLNTLQVNKNLSVSGNASIQGTLALQNNLSVNGSASFSGPVSAPQLTVNNLQLSGNLVLTSHIQTNGSIPSVITLGAAGSGGTSSINGSDTAGTVTINSGNSPSAGCYINVNFTTGYSSTPHVLITPVGPNAANLSYYINRSTSNFSVCSTNSPQAGQTYVYDYFVID